MIQPIININGTARRDHVRIRREAIDSLRQALSKLALCLPDGRDYPGNPERYAADRQAHFDRMNALRDLSEELLQEALVIQRGAD